MSGAKTYISFGDLVDLYYKIKQKGLGELFSKFHLSDTTRTASKWNTVRSSSDFWVIPEIHRRWREKCTNDPEKEYEAYFCEKYLSGTTGLKMLSVGCGAGSRERKFAKFPHFDSIEGIDIAENLLAEGREAAEKQKLNTISYINGDFVAYSFTPASYDIILFNSS
ncbi:MAG TPA: class I SAM-dependent methyltransferase, partial [Bacteroidales bacterium]|nr:class I SAM-dependent methyltransferase [Bacteroidales bacterium]